MGYLKQNPGDREQRLKLIQSGMMKRSKALKEELATEAGAGAVSADGDV